MENKNKKIQSFTDLDAWKKSHGLVIEIYSLTKKFPREEQFGLTNQIRRATVSVSSNIAEGFSRTSFKEKSQFYSMALGSLTEVQNQILIARDIGYLDKDFFEAIADKTITISKLLNGLIKKTKEYSKTHTSYFTLHNSGRLDRSGQEGYMALMSAIIISALLMIITFSLSFGSFMTRYNILEREYKKESYNLAQACMNIAMLELVKNNSYSGNEDKAVNGKTCRIESVIATFPSGYGIETSSSVPAATDGAKTVLYAEVNNSDFSLISLIEKD